MHTNATTHCHMTWPTPPDNALHLPQQTPTSTFPPFSHLKNPITLSLRAIRILNNRQQDALALSLPDNTSETSTSKILAPTSPTSNSFATHHHLQHWADWEMGHFNRVSPLELPSWTANNYFFNPKTQRPHQKFNKTSKYRPDNSAILRPFSITTSLKKTSWLNSTFIHNLALLP